MSPLKVIGDQMTPYRIILVLMAALLCLGPATAQERTVTVGVPAGPLVQLVQSLGAVFRAVTGIAVAAVKVNPDGPPSTAGIDAVLLLLRVLEALLRRRFHAPGMRSAAYATWRG